jgi:chromosome segregation ATPase
MSSEYRRMAKDSGDYDVMKSIQKRIAEERARLEEVEAKYEKAQRVQQRWSSTASRLYSERMGAEERIRNLEKSLNAISHEVDEYGIPKREPSAA